MIRITSFIVLAFLIVFYPSYKWIEYRLSLSRVPNELRPAGIGYECESVWGYGPGGNETGVVIFSLPEEVASKIMAQGNGFFSDAKNISLRSSRFQQAFSNWRTTPLTPNDWNWSHDTTALKTSVNIEDLLNKYGFSIDLEPKIIITINNTLNTSGSYFAYGVGGSIIIVSPKLRQIILAYAG